MLDSETASCLKPDVLYKLVETKAPTDYQLDDTPHYLLFRKNARAENEQQAFAKATGQADGTTTLTVDGETVNLNSNVQVGSDAGTTTAEYSNVYSNLTVRKFWLDADTRQPVEPAVDSIRIKVWQYPDKAKTLFAEADLTAGNNWTWSESGTRTSTTTACRPAISRCRTKSTPATSCRPPAAWARHPSGCWAAHWPLQQPCCWSANGNRTRRSEQP